MLARRAWRSMTQVGYKSDHPRAAAYAMCYTDSHAWNGRECLIADEFGGRCTLAG